MKFQNFHRHILSLRSPNEVDEYFSTLLDYSCEDHVKFVSNFKEQRYKQKSRDSKKKGAIAKTPASPAPADNSRKDNGKVEGEKSKKKNKFTNLYSAGGKVSEIMLKGRHLCNCQASKHKLVNNCLNCGRIVCEQEGPGPCLFCGTSVKRTEDTEYGNEKPEPSTKGNGTKPKVTKDKEDAIAQRNRLLGYDRQSEKRTTVIDDEADYFKANSVWLSDQEREKMQKLEEELRDRKHANRLRHKYKFDFSGRQILDDEDILDYDAYENIENIPQSHSQGKALKEIDMNQLKFDEAFPEVNPNDSKHTKFTTSKIQDKMLIELSDQGCCLSMHQPWASLLVLGIKKHEGRSWYTSHRGRLWIASTAKPANPEEVKQIEDFYRRFYGNDKLKFPTQYPSGSLLGHVTVENCISQEDYLLEYPAGESESPFVFICTNPVQLPVFFPISGKHKICKLNIFSI